MSIATAISALQSASSDIASAIAAKGVTVPSGSGFDDYATLIGNIQTGGGGGLYTPVDYIQTDGVAYINTGIKGNAPMYSEMKITPMLASSFATHLGSRSGNNRFMLTTQWGDSGYAYDNYISFGYSTSNFQGVSMATSISNRTPLIVRGELAKGKQMNGIKQSGASSFTYSSSGTVNSAISTNLNMFIFANNVDGAVSQHSPSGTRVHFCRIFTIENTLVTLLFDGMPCIYNGSYGLWDNVTNSFFGNAAGSGAFSGPTIN